MSQHWTLWYHDPANNDYSLQSYIRIFQVKDVSDFWTIVDGIPKEMWESGMFFFMRGDIPPLWDAPENDKGGAWSKKVDAGDTHAVFVDCMVHCIAESFLKGQNDTVSGVTVSPKGQFHIVKIWNSTTKVSDRKLFNPTLKMKLGDDIAYKAHNQRPK
uniref:Eukaryotic translation initiation factor 4E n=1 Tax=viral metagenome TaxID=1070528 RepID=A0A6C0JIQ5_9ZZZZ